MDEGYERAVRWAWIVYLFLNETARFLVEDRGAVGWAVPENEPGRCEWLWEVMRDL